MKSFLKKKSEEGSCIHEDAETETGSKGNRRKNECQGTKDRNKLRRVIEKRHTQ